LSGLVNSSATLKENSKETTKKSLTSDLTLILKLLIADKKLPGRFRDHSLIGDWRDHRDCHIKPDLVLIYRKPDEFKLQLVRLGSHSELGL
jgi:mRNA interferase YafQ